MAFDKSTYAPGAPLGHRRVASGGGSSGSSESSSSDWEDSRRSPEDEQHERLDSTMLLLHRRLLNCLDLIKVPYIARVDHKFQEHPFQGLRNIIEYEKALSSPGSLRVLSYDGLSAVLAALFELDQRIDHLANKLSLTRETVSTYRAQLSEYQARLPFLSHARLIKHEKIQQLQAELNEFLQEDSALEAAVIQLKQERIDLIMRLLSGIKELWPVPLASVTLDDLSQGQMEWPRPAEGTFPSVPRTAGDERQYMVEVGPSVRS